MQDGAEVVAGPVPQEPAAVLEPGEGTVVLPGAGGGGIGRDRNAVLQIAH